MRRRVIVVVLSGLAAACSTIHHRPVTQPASCATDARVVGAWTDARMTFLGPAWVKMALGADCRYTMRIQMLFARIVETGHYTASDGVLNFERRSTTTRWPYRVDGGRLEIREAPEERHIYTRR